MLVDVWADNRFDEEKAKRHILEDPPWISRSASGIDKRGQHYSFSIRGGLVESVRKVVKFRKETA